MKFEKADELMKQLTTAQKIIFSELLFSIKLKTGNVGICEECHHVYHEFHDEESTPYCPNCGS